MSVSFGRLTAIPGVDELPGDADLLKSAREGDEQAFLELYRRHRTPLYRFAWRMAGSSETAQDVVQECFLALLKGAAFDGRRDLRTYLFGVARHLALRSLRLAGQECEEQGEPASASGPLEDLLAAERSALVERSIRALPVLQREALVLFEYEDLSLEQIAAIARVDVGAVKARLHRARESMRRRLGPLLAPAAERSCT